MQRTLSSQAKEQKMTIMMGFLGLNSSLGDILLNYVPKDILLSAFDIANIIIIVVVIIILVKIVLGILLLIKVTEMNKNIAELIYLLKRGDSDEPIIKKMIHR